MRVTIYAGSAFGDRVQYRAKLARFVQDLVGAGHDIVYGGGRTGLMGVAADAALAAGGRVTGVIPRSLVDGEGAHPKVSDLRVVDTMHERKQLMADLSDCFVAAPGSVGTLEELMEVWAWLILGDHEKPVMVLNTDGFWDPQLRMLRRMVRQGFMSPQEEASLVPIGDISDFDTVVGSWKPPPPRWANSVPIRRRPAAVAASYPTTGWYAKRGHQGGDAGHTVPASGLSRGLV